MAPTAWAKREKYTTRFFYIEHRKLERVYVWREPGPKELHHSPRELSKSRILRRIAVKPRRAFFCKSATEQ